MALATQDITVSNTLNGPDSGTPDDTALGVSSVAGVVTIADPGTRAVYTTDTTVRGRTTIRVGTGHHRAGGTSGEGAATPRLVGELPDTGVWVLRFYTRIPGLQAAGHGADEVRYLADLGDYALVVHESSGGDLRLRMQPTNDLAAAGTTATLSGDPVAPGQLVRVEVVCDGSDTVATLYPGHATTGGRVCTWSGLAPSGDTVTVTGFRYRRGVLLVRGNTDDTTGGAVTPRQEQLQLWSPGILPSGVDGIYGSETEDAVVDFQTAFGLQPVDGQIGPETGAALDLMEQTENATATPPPVLIGWLAVGDFAEEIGPALPISRSNTANGPPGDPVTTFNSADHGDRWDAADDGIDYANRSYAGRSSLRFAGGFTSGTGVAWQQIALADFSVRGYVYRTSTAESGHLAWAPHVGGCSLTSGGGLSWAGLSLPEGTVPADQWVRVEFRRAGGTVHLAVFSSDPQSTTPDASTSGELGRDEITQWWWERFGAGTAWWDEPALVDNADPLGPVELPEPAGFRGVGLPMFAGA